jgi:hypothetical protein
MRVSTSMTSAIWVDVRPGVDERLRRQAGRGDDDRADERGPLRVRIDAKAPRDDLRPAGFALGDDLEPGRPQAVVVEKQPEEPARPIRVGDPGLRPRGDQGRAHRLIRRAAPARSP